MAEALGFRNVAPDLVTAFVVIAVIAAVLMGYATDLLMREAGFGVLGNAVIVLLGLGGAVVGWNSHVAPVGSSDPLVIIAVAAGGALLFLVALALLKRLR